MSHGPGITQRFLWQTVCIHGKPMTFAEIRSVAAYAAILPGVVRLAPSVERSLRRALQTMVRDEVLLALGSGGRGDPHRYFPNPLLAAAAGDEARFEAWVGVLEQQPDGSKL
jgi:hypothetical protein